MSWEDLESDAKSLAGNTGPRCGVRIMLDYIRNEHGENAHESVVRTLYNYRLTTSSIHRALESRVEPDYLPSTYSLGRHRSGRCSCPKEES